MQSSEEIKTIHDLNGNFSEELLTFSNYNLQLKKWLSGMELLELDKLVSQMRTDALAIQETFTKMALSSNERLERDFYIVTMWQLTSPLKALFQPEKETSSLFDLTNQSQKVQAIYSFLTFLLTLDHLLPQSLRDLQLTAALYKKQYAHLVQPYFTGF